MSPFQEKREVKQGWRPLVSKGNRIEQMRKSYYDRSQKKTNLMKIPYLVRILSRSPCLLFWYFHKILLNDSPAYSYAATWFLHKRLRSYLSDFQLQSSEIQGEKQLSRSLSSRLRQRFIGLLLLMFQTLLKGHKKLIPKLNLLKYSF